MMNFLNKKSRTIIKNKQNEQINKYNDLINSIMNKNYSFLSNIEIKEKSFYLMKNIDILSESQLLVESYTLVYEAIKRVLNITPYRKQLLGAIALYNNYLIQMNTGEGKTLTAVFSAYLYGIRKKGVHILTFNDYLAKRDAIWMESVYNLLGLSVGFIQENMSPIDRKTMYNADITYVTAKESGFDFLRDSLVYTPSEKVHRNFHHAIVDEADSILIDEARIPLVIAGLFKIDTNTQVKINRIIQTLTEDVHFERDDYGKNIFLTQKGLNLVEKKLGINNLYDESNNHFLSQIHCALYAHNILNKDVDYIIKDTNIEMVDELTGRIANNRKWPDGIQEAIGIKEGIQSNNNGKILDSITIQNYIKLYPSISGMTATALSSKDEFYNFYELEVFSIPPNKENIRIDLPDLIFTCKEEKYHALIVEIISVNKTGRPILIGTSSIQESELISQMLVAHGLSPEVLNAKNDTLEAKIIANAGNLNAITVSTNMAGRGTDIKLGGINEKNFNQVLDLGGLYVVGTNRHESKRIDNQLRGRAGRQGEPGSTRFYISLEDDLLIKFGIKKALSKKYFSSNRSEPINDSSILKVVDHIQRVSNGQNFDIRKTLYKYAYIFDQQREILKNLRENILLYSPCSLSLKVYNQDLYTDLKNQLDEETLNKLICTITLYNIDKCWSEFLEHIEYIKEGIHLVSICGKRPIDEYHQLVIIAFKEMKSKIKENINNCLITNDFNSIVAETIEKRPSSTITYLVSDDYFVNNIGSEYLSVSNLGMSSSGIAMSIPAIVLNTLIKSFKKLFKTKK